MARVVNGSLYGVPDQARQEANLIQSTNHSLTLDLTLVTETRNKWYRGTMTDSGVIYCSPQNRRRGIIKIDTNTDMIAELTANLHPEQGGCMWISCATALARDECIYFTPCCACRIMKLAIDQCYCCHGTCTQNVNSDT